ncbi:hypothetical protein A3A54_00985 [Candidatus Curtissbacteria bacterium RIFCSPLOWO2_01_FULL_39_62]|uniref:AB hydrolase-1 domain-containing protein n=2 Tax=Candidatus Curtissiibacteriota TaxID=1752717 RepID=A0A1F5G8J6_9BACT|nr:MAG: hypothetical protein A3D04_01610 [Candidatus Curtissbacteria bacterium RIFCSPHIGHO2_02_FULL_40_16b]OGE00496.1 MAG: hypothetical protein A3J17_05005 [Candidatus Curtissbacteria bacterium RIFCSPLOWO2_02_FULL_40_11]OGE00532.1 MAG: hypothetical protein A3A54_00985 [Candidatus Curtissbacteria bacterium RIFCSPLOWO2_01_FULL_39_62]
MTDERERNNVLAEAGLDQVTGERWNESSRRESTVNVDGVDVHYIQGGKGPDLVLVSGLLGSSRGFDFVTSPLGESYRVTAVDLPGYGVSGQYPRNRRYSPEESAKTVIEVMDKLGIEKAGFVGDSYGCAIGLTVAVNYPDRISSLVLQGPTRIDPLKAITKLPEYVAAKMAKDIQGAKALTYWARRINPEFKNMNSEQLKNADARMSAVLPKAAIQSTFDLLNFDWREYASRLGVPTLVIEGADAIVIPFSSSRIIRNAAAPGLVKIKRIKGRHTLLQQRPQEFVEEVKQFHKRAVS